MEARNKKNNFKLTKISKSRLISLMLLITMLVQLFSPYGILLNKADAATLDPDNDPLILVSASEIGANRVVKIQYGVVGGNITSFDFNIGFDSSKMVLANKKTGAALSLTSTAFGTATSCADVNGDLANLGFNKGANTKPIAKENRLRIAYNHSSGSCINLDDEGYSIDDLGEEETFGYNYYLHLFTLYFLVVDDSVTEMTKDMIYWDPLKNTDGSINPGMPTGFKYIYSNDGEHNLTIVQPKNVVYSGFSDNTPEKQVTELTVVTDPTNPTEHGNTIDLTGGKLHVVYDDGSEEDIDMTDEKVTIVVPSDKLADVDNPQITLSFKSKTVQTNISVTDPMTKFSVKTPMTDIEYDHGEGFNFAGLTFEAETKSGKKTTVQPNEVTPSETSASVNSSKFTQASIDGNGIKRGTQEIVFTYTKDDVTKTANQIVTVNDAIDTVKVKTQPTKKIYKRGESLDLTGATIEIALKSGGTPIVMAPPSGSVTGYSNTTTGVKQKLPVTVGGITATGTIDVEVYNNIISSSIQPPTNTTIQYGGQLSLTGGSINYTYAGGTQGTVKLTDCTISGFDGTQIGQQGITAEYTVQHTLSDGTKIPEKITKTFYVDVENSITGITIDAPAKTTYNHGEAFDLTGGKITITYADNSKDYPSITPDMIFESDGTTVATTSPASYDATNKVTKTLKIKYSEDGKTGTVDYPITIINDVKKIEMHKTPKATYNVNDSLDVSNGEILVTRAVGTASVVAMTDSKVKVEGFSSTSENTNLPLTVKYTENGITKQTSYNVVVKDSVKSITLKTEPKKNYKYNEELDVTGGVLTVVSGSGTKDVTLTKDMVTGYDKTELGDQTLTVTYGGQTTTYVVNVKDYVTGIKVNPATVTGKYDDTLGKLITDNTITYTVTYAKVGDRTQGTLLESMVAGYNPKSIQTQNLTVTYTDNNDASATKGTPFTATLNITLQDEVDTIVVTAPSKDTYNHGENLATDGTITVTTKSGQSKTVPMTANMIFENDGTTVASTSPASYDTTNKLEKTLKIKYTEGGKTGTVDYPITIINDVKKIEMHKAPKTTYNVNDSLDVSDGEILVTRAVGTASVVAMTDSKVKVEGFNSTAENTNLPLTVKYTENGITKQTNYNVVVKDSVKSITLKTEPKKDYKYNEELDVAGGVLTVVSGSGTKDVTLTKDMVTGYDKTELGDQTLTVTYGGQTTTYVVNVKDYVTGIKVNPATVTGKYDDTLGKLITDNTITYTVTYAKAGDRPQGTLLESMVAGYNPKSIQTQNLTVTYTDNNDASATKGTPFTSTLNITLQDEVDTIVITAPSKDTYNHGEGLATNGTITVTTKSGQSKTVPMTANMIFENDGTTVASTSPASYDTTNKLEKTLKIKYTEGGKTGTIDYPITIINDVKKIEMHKDPKTTYNVNDTLDKTNGEILVTRAVGTASVVSLEDSKVKVEGFSSLVENPNLSLTVKYTENGITKQTNYNVVIKDSVKSITLKTEPKKDYKYNEELDVAGGVLTVVSGSGTKDVTLTKDMVTGYDKTELGDQTLTVTYGGQTTTYVVNVKDYVTGIKVNPATVTGKYDDTLGKLITDNTITYTVTYAKVGDRPQGTLLESMVAGYNPKSIQTQSLTVTYTDNNDASATKGTPFTATLNITLQDEVDTIVVTAPSKDTYNHGETLATDGTITVTTKSGQSKTVPMTTNMIFENDGTTVASTSPASYDDTNKMTKTLKIKYSEEGKDGTVDYPITIINDVKKIEMNKNPKTSYNVNDTLDITGGEIKVSRAVGEPSIVSLEDSRVVVEGFVSSTENTNLPLTVKYTENGITKDTSYNVSVKDSVKSIRIKTEPKKNYKYNEELDVTGGVLEVVKGSATTDVQMLASMVTGYDKTELGDQTLTVTYGGQTATYTVNVKDYVTEITLVPDTATGKYDDTLGKVISDNNIKYIVNYAKVGQMPAVDLSEEMVAGYNPQTIQTQNLTVTYTDNNEASATKGDPFIATLNITLQDEVDTIVVTAPSKDTYNHGETLATDGTITVTTKSGQSKTVPMTANMIFEDDGTTLANTSPASFDDTNKMTKILKIKYSEDGKDGTVDYPITIINDVKKIEMHKNPKTSYNVNDTLDITGGEILVTRAVGTASVVSLEDNKVTVEGFDSTIENSNLPLTVKYTENGITKDTSYNVSVKDSVKSISIKADAKKDYRYNEELDVSTGIITVVKGSETKDIPMTADMVTGYDKTELGDQTLTVTYGGQIATYVVNVKDYVTGIKVNPSTIAGEYNDTLADLISNNNIEYSVTYAKAGDVAQGILLESMVEGYDPTSASQSLTVIYIDNDSLSATIGKDFTETLNITIDDPITGISVKDKPDQLDYGFGEELDTTGGTITVTRKSGQTEEIPFTATGVTITETDGTPVDVENVTLDSEHKGTKTIQVNYEGKTDTFEINITNEIESIVVIDTPKTNYYIGDSIDLTTDGTTPGTIEVTRQNGEKETINLNDPKVQVTGFDSTAENTNLSLTVSYTENSITKTTNYTVSVIEDAQNVEIENTPKTAYKYGEPLDVSTGTLKVTKASGEEKSIPMTPNMVTEMDGTPFNPNQLGTRNLKVTYGGQEMTYEITVSDYVKDIVLTPPTKLIYEYGENLSLEGGKLEIIMASGDITSPIELNDSRVNLSAFNPTQVGAQTINVEFDTFKGNFGVIVEDNIQSIVITTPPKTAYKYGENLDVAGGKITATRTSGQTEEIDITVSMVTGYNPNQLGDQPLTVTYKDKTASYTVNVADFVKGIDIVKPDKLLYKIGESLDLTGGLINLVMASGTATSPVAMSQATITGFDSNTEGAKTISVTYQGFTKTFGITVVDPLSEMIIFTLPDKLDYKYGENLDVTGGSIKVIKESGDSEIIPMTPSMVTGFNPKKLGNQTLTVTYEDLTQQYIVNVEDYIDRLEVKAPAKVEYEYGEDLDLAGGKVAIVMASGNRDEAEMTASMVSGFNKTKEGTQNLKVEYKGLTGSFNVKVTDKIKAIAMNTDPDKTTYEYNEPIDITGGTILVIKSSGTSIVPITKDMISGYNPKQPGTQAVTVNYGGFTTKFVVKVNEQVIVNKPETPKPQPPSRPQVIVKTETIVKTEVVEKVEEPVQEPVVETPKTEKPPKEEEKPVQVLGVKEEKKEEPQEKTLDKRIIAGIIAALGLLLLLILLLYRKNVKIYVEEDGEFQLAGTDRITKRRPEIDLDEYLDEDNYNNRIKIVLADSISEKLDGEELEITYNDKVITHKVEYDDEPYVIMLNEQQEQQD